MILVLFFRYSFFIILTSDLVVFNTWEQLWAVPAGPNNLADPLLVNLIVAGEEPW